ncbi:MAG: quinol:cytochrome C oxidoreductase [Planctomycetes bacterium]|nr:quinol:cytochrome C oxidoreductase [Planctomycetota bacterium]
MQSSFSGNLSLEEETLRPSSPRVRNGLIGGGLGLLLIALAIELLVGGGWASFVHSYLTSLAFFVSLSVGCLFFVALQHACRAGWSVAVRRVAELLAANILVLAVAFLPIVLTVLVGSPSLYGWADTDFVTDNALLMGKRAYLNGPFFAARSVVYFAVWAWLGWHFLTKSCEQDRSGNPELTVRMERISYPALLLFAATVTFAAFDWLMSLTPEWYSTIFGVYYFSGSVVGSLAAVILLLLGLQWAGHLREAVTTEHYHDLGKLLFGFVVFWGYIAFSQYLLIWYANIPEETSWYWVRQQGPWIGISLALLFGHLIVPFFGLLSREAKRCRWSLGFWSVWLLVFHWLDLYYLVMPHADRAGVPFRLTDVLCWAGMGLVYLFGLLRIAEGRSLVAVRDPRLAESLSFENV